MESRLALIVGIMLIATSTAALLIKQPTPLAMVLAGIVASMGAALLVLATLAARWRQVQVGMRQEDLPAEHRSPAHDAEAVTALVG